MATDRPRDILVLGGTGKTGRRVAERLRTAGHRVRVASRANDPAFDWERPETWGPVLAGARAVYVAYYPDLAVPSAPEAIERITHLAHAEGVERLVLLSGRGEDDALRAEEVVQGGQVPWTIVRCSWFAQNFSEGHFAEQIASGEVALPVDTVREPFVDADDIADVAVAALTMPGHERKLYELTGPRAITFAEAVDEIAAATKRPIRFTPITLEQYVTAMGDAGLPGDVVALISYLFTEVLHGRNTETRTGVRDALGREATDFRTYAQRASAAGEFAVAS
jgi:uncharacterized protein YbjT (DUF2867 family)